MTTIHEHPSGWRFKNSPNGVLFSRVGWVQESWDVLCQSPVVAPLKAYIDLCPLPPDPPTLEFGGVEYTRDKLGCWSDDWGQVPSVHRMADFIAKQGDYAEDTE